MFGSLEYIYTYTIYISTAIKELGTQINNGRYQEGYEGYLGGISKSGSYTLTGGCSKEGMTRGL
jgi:hypothetical protein